MRKVTLATWCLVAALTLLAAFSLYLALNRIYQVDEAQNLFMAKVVGARQMAQAFTIAPLWFLGPLGGLAANAGAAADLFTTARLLFLGLFWLNITLLALCAGARLTTRRGWVLFLLAASLPALWDHGLEVRHDNLILGGLLLMWWLGRVRAPGIAGMLAVGFLGGILPFIAFKAVVYAVPLAGLLVLARAAGSAPRRWGLAWAGLAGAGAALAVARLAYASAGLWSFFLHGYGGSVGTSRAAEGFGMSMSLTRFLAQSPLLAGLALAGLVGSGMALRRKEGPWLDWTGPLPEAVLCLLAFAALAVNPTPFPYNLVNLAPFAFLLAVRQVEPLLASLESAPGAAVTALAVLAGAHALPFVQSAWRHLDYGNERQVLLMETAEQMTDRQTDPVYDAVGLVPTRPSIGFQWYLHSLNIQEFRRDGARHVGDLLRERPPAVIMPNYRMEWLLPGDWAVIRERYLPLADDFWVLGGQVAPGGKAFTVHHPGRYQLLEQHGGTLVPLAKGDLDGRPYLGGGVALLAGPHEIFNPAGLPVLYVWLGPRLATLPELGPGDHRRLFVNWY